MYPSWDLSEYLTTPLMPYQAVNVAGPNERRVLALSDTVDGVPCDCGAVPTENVHTNKKDAELIGTRLVGDHVQRQLSGERRELLQVTVRSGATPADGSSLSHAELTVLSFSLF